ncbi:MAG: hypothetical protein H7070_15780 [Saprospiraceae bacterium]|nr:hypothetical protein [Pyrinomonadaceae bacterium]
MKIAKIVSSNSHIDYIGRVIDELDTNEPPNAGDYGFAEFVSLQFGSDDVVGVIYDSKLVNPEYASYGPRLSPKPGLQNFTPDFINEQGILIGILLLGTIDVTGIAAHGVPKRIVPPGQDVSSMDAAAIKRFHEDESGSVQMHYYSQVVSHAGLLAVPLLESIIENLLRSCSGADGQRLGLLKQTLTWQRTMGGMKL